MCAQVNLSHPFPRGQRKVDVATGPASHVAGERAHEPLNGDQTMRNDARLFPAVNRTVRQINRRWAAEPLECRRMFNNMAVFGTPFDDTCIIEMDASFIFATMNGVLIPQPIGGF